MLVPGSETERDALLNDAKPGGSGGDASLQGPPDAADAPPPSPGPPPWLATAGQAWAFGVGLLAMLASGTLYAFGAYADELKQSLALSQPQAEAVGYSGDIGVYLASPFAGALHDAYGPRLCAFLAAALLGTGYTVLASLAATGPAPGAAGAAALSLALAGLGSGTLYISTLATCVAAFPAAARGRVIGPLVSLYGLSALGATGLYALYGFRADRVGDFLGVLAAATAAPAVLAALALPWGMPPRLPAPSETDPEACGVGGWGALGAPLRRSGAAAAALAISRPFWLCACVLVLLGGSGLMLINNLGSAGKAIGGGGGLKTGAVAALAVANFAGRIAAGAAADAAPSRRGWVLCFAAAAASATFAWPAVLGWGSGGLVALCVGVGLAYGAMWALLPTIVTELVGPETFGASWGWAVLCPAAGALAFNAAAGALYERASRQGESRCDGEACFQGAWALGACACAAAGACAAVLAPHAARATRVSVGRNVDS